MKFRIPSGAEKLQGWPYDLMPILEGRYCATCGADWTGMNEADVVSSVVSNDVQGGDVDDTLLGTGYIPASEDE